MRNILSFSGLYLIFIGGSQHELLQNNLSKGSLLKIKNTVYVVGFCWMSMISHVSVSCEAYTMIRRQQV